MDALDEKIPLKISPSKNPEGPLVVPPVHIDKDCEISQDAQVGPYTVLGEGCHIQSGAVVKNSILWADVSVSPGLTVQNSILGEGVSINKNVNNNSLPSET